MPDSKTSALTAVTTPVSTDEFHVAQSGTDRKMTRAQVHALESGEHLVLPQVSEVSTPTLAFGDGNSGIHETSDNVLAIVTAGTAALTIDANQKGTFSGDVVLNSNFAIEGYATGRNIIRSANIRIQPGASAGTNINVTSVNESTQAFNSPTITDTTDLAKSGSGGSFALSADGTIITMDLTEAIIGILGYSIITHDINSSSTTEMYFPLVDQSSNNMRFIITKRGSVAAVDWTTIMDAGDRVDIQVSFVTST